MWQKTLYYIIIFFVNYISSNKNSSNFMIIFITDFKVNKNNKIGIIPNHFIDK